MNAPPRTREPSPTSFVAPSRWFLILLVVMFTFDTWAGGGVNIPPDFQALIDDTRLVGTDAQEFLLRRGRHVVMIWKW